MAERLVWFLLVDQEGVAYKGTTASKVKLPADGDVDDLRKAVYAENAGILQGIVPSQLLVYADKTVFDANTADVPTNLQPEGDIGVYGAKDAKMYVVIPESAVHEIDAASLPAQIEMAVTKAFDQRDRKRSVYSISKCPESKESLFMQELGLAYSTVVVPEKPDASIPGYQWPDLTEKHPEQRKAYMEYIEQHLHDALMSRRKQVDFLKDVAGKRHLLDCDNRNLLPFEVTGTTDLVIIDEQANRMDDIFGS